MQIEFASNHVVTGLPQILILARHKPDWDWQQPISTINQRLNHQRGGLTFSLLVARLEALSGSAL